MPGEGDREKFKRDVVEGSELNYVQKMIYFYSSMLDDLSRKIGEETEYGVPGSLSMIEKRLSEFEEREKKLIENYRKFARKVKGIKI
jgi:hypothetical protein